MTKRRHREAPFSLFAFQDIITSVTGILLLIMLLLCLSLVTRELKRPQTVTRSDGTPSTTDPTAALQARVEELRQRLAEQKARNERLLEMSPSQAVRRRVELTAQHEELKERIGQLRNDARLKRSLATRPDSSEETELKETVHQKEQQAENLKKKLAKIKNSRRLVYHPSDDDGRQAWVMQVDAMTILVARAGRREPAQRFTSSQDTLRWIRETRQSDEDYFVLFVRPSGIPLYRELLISLMPLGFKVGLDLIGEDQIVVDPLVGAGEPE